MTDPSGTAMPNGFQDVRTGLKRLMPRGLVRWRFVLRQLSAADRLALVEWAVRRRFSPRSWREPLARAKSVAFICQGNIIRSPFAAAAFSNDPGIKARGITVASAGVGARPGEKADPRAMRAAQELGIAMDGHRSRLVDGKLLGGSDVIFAMDYQNVARLVSGYPELAHRVFLLGGCRPDGSAKLAEIHDPVMGTVDDVRKAHAEVLKGLRVILGTEGKREQGTGKR